MAGARNYLIVTASYWSFTLTDGALRMLVLLHFYTLGYTPFMLASLFLLYETAGIFANLGGGWLATRFGIPRMLATGLVLQIGGLMLLSALDPAWSATLSVAWVVMAQGISGVAKDITKTASKSAIKATSEGGAGQLFRWVAWFTGSKNAMKGFGFFVGGFCSKLVGFRAALWLMAAMLAVVLVNVLLSLPSELGKAKASKSFGELFAKSRAINLLAAARIFLFGSRDVWFVVGLPVFLYAHGWKYMEVAGFSPPGRSATGWCRRSHHRWSGAAPTDFRGRSPKRRSGGGAYGDSGGCRVTLGIETGYQCRSARRRRSQCIRLRLRRDLVAALLSDPGLCGIKEGRRGRRLLLCGQCCWAAVRHPVVRFFDAIRRAARVLVGLGGDARNLPRADVHASRRRRTPAGAGGQLIALGRKGSGIDAR